MSAFIVVKQGVYMRGVYGPFATQAEARTQAQALADADSDSYHTWDVHSLTATGIADGDDALVSFRKGRAPIEQQRSALPTVFHKVGAEA